MVVIRQFAPQIPEGFPTINGGRVQSISVNPSNDDYILVANEFGGLWKTTDRGTTWFHIDSLPGVFVRDVSYAPDGMTVIATLARDNRVNNGGGIYVSRDGGESWIKVESGDPHRVRLPDGSGLPDIDRIPDRISAYGISYSPDDPNMVYVGTDYGVAISTDNGRTWFHKMLENASSIWTDYRQAAPKMQNSVISIMALPNNRAIALSGTGVYRVDQRYIQGTTWSWRKIIDGNFIYMWNLSCKNIDASPLDSNKVFILKDYFNLVLYNVANGLYVYLPLPPPPRLGGNTPYIARGPFIRVSRSSKSVSSVELWVGQGYYLLNLTISYDELERLANLEKPLLTVDWWTQITTLRVPQGIHDDTGYLALDNNKRPLLYGCDGGLFLPPGNDRANWTGIATGRRGTNSLQITDCAGTNVSPTSGENRTSLYFGTQDNNVWASPDNGNRWPNSVDPEGFAIEVRKDATSDSEVRVAFTIIARMSRDNPRFADANLTRNWRIPDVVGGTILPGMLGGFYVSPNKWIRYRNPNNGFREIYISYDNGESWMQRAVVRHGHVGGFLVSGDPSSPTIYTAIRASRTLQDGRPIICLLKLTNMFPNLRPGETAQVLTFDDNPSPFSKPGNNPFIYLPDNGSLGIRATNFDWHAVYGVNPENPDHIIAPDIYHQVVKVSRNGGVSWITDSDLTREVTKNGELLLYDNWEYRMQVTQISFDPYRPNRILVGTRDAGVIVSGGVGDSWTIPNSDVIPYVTNFFFKRNNTVIVSSYGRGLWKIDFNAFGDNFPFEKYCQEGDCVVRRPYDVEILEDPVDWSDKDVTIFLNGQIKGLDLSGNEIKLITLSPGTVFKRYIGNTKKDYNELNIVESDKGDFKDLEGCLAALRNGEIIKGIILKENQIVGIISGKQQIKEEAKEVKETKEDQPGERWQETNSKQQPYLFITTSIPLSGLHLIGNDGVINIFATGFRFDPNGKNDINISVDGVAIDHTAKVSENGIVQSQLEVQAAELSYGIHTVQLLQKLEKEEITASDSFVKASID